MEAIVLAGGLGTRLRGVTGETPKSMALIAGRPFLEYTLDYLIKNKITKVILSIGYQGQYIKSYFGNEYKGLAIKYSHEEQPLGTGGAIVKALSCVNSENVFVLNGDSIFIVPLDNLYKFHILHKADITLSVKLLKNYDRYGTVVLDKNFRVTKFKEKLFTTTGLINGGVYLVNKNTLNSICLPEIFSFEKELLQNKLADIKEYGYVTDAYFKDIGIPEDYEKAQYEFKAFM